MKDKLKVKIAAAAIAGLAAIGVFQSALRAQETAKPPRSVWDGVYTEEQARRGETLYSKECASCHRDDTGGEEATALAGPAFLANWGGLTVGDLFDRIRVSMPPDNPRRLSRRQIADILGHMLKLNGFPAGKTELIQESEALKQIRIEATKTLITSETALMQQRPSGEAADRRESPSAGWKLVWADEFGKDGRPDPRNWGYESGFVRNRELQWYQPDNAWCEKGLLIIEGRRERKQNPNYDSNSKDWKASREYVDYTSASLITKGRREWQYGRFEMRGRIDTRQGLWPAFWTLGVEGRWPSNGEVDIMEYYRGILLANVAWASEKPWTPVWDDLKKPITEFNDPDWSGKFHVWRMDWDEKVIRLYVDDVLLNSTDLKDTFNRYPEGKNPFHQPHYLLLNLAIGGTNGGDPSKTDFPARFEVDYVRVYQK